MKLAQISGSWRWPSLRTTGKNFFKLKIPRFYTSKLNDRTLNTTRQEAGKEEGKHGSCAWCSVRVTGAPSCESGKTFTELVLVRRNFRSLSSPFTFSFILQSSSLDMLMLQMKKNVTAFSYRNSNCLAISKVAFDKEYPVVIKSVAK